KAYDFGTRAVNVKYHFQNNAGPSKARNQGIKLAQGRYVTFLDSDDIWSPDYLRIIESIMDKYDSEIIEFNAARFIEENANLKIHNNYTLVDEEYHGPINERILSEVFVKSEWYV
ncbi:TPA: glycosyltransferase family A protein, partial [Escherichia coli]